VDELKAKFARLNALKTMSEADRKERDQTIADLNKATLARAPFILGVPESEIQLIVSLSSRTAGKVNIIGSPGKGSPGGGHSPLGGQTGFEEGLASAIHIDLPEARRSGGYAHALKPKDRAAAGGTRPPPTSRRCRLP
jgi:hypothetical protein